MQSVSGLVILLSIITKLTDVILVITPSEKTLPVRLNMDIITHLQEKLEPNLFTPRAVYDGRKNLFAAHPLRFANGDSQTVCSQFFLA